MSLIDFSGPALFGIGMLAVGVLAVGVTGRYVWRSTGIYRAATVDGVAEASVGDLVRFTGAVQDGPAEPLTAPFSGQRCRAIRYAIEERRLSPHGLPWYLTIHETAGSVPFRVRTATATIDVEAPARTVTLERQVVATVGPDETPPERIGRFERETDGLPETTIWGSPPGPLRPIARALSFGTREYLEQRAETGEAVTVVGRVTEDGGVDPMVVSDRQPLATAIRMAKTSFVGLAAGVAGIALGVVLVAFV